MWQCETTGYQQSNVCGIIWQYRILISLARRVPQAARGGRGATGRRGMARAAMHAGMRAARRRRGRARRTRHIMARKTHPISALIGVWRNIRAAVMAYGVWRHGDRQEVCHTRYYQPRAPFVPLIRCAIMLRLVLPVHRADLQRG